MNMKVLLSIKPEFAEKILSGEKTFEFRRAVFKDPKVSAVVIYASSPVQKVVGEFSIDDVYEMPPAELWEKTSQGSGIDRKYFDAYFEGKRKGYAIKVGRVFCYDSPINLGSLGIKTPPQSFCYLDR